MLDEHEWQLFVCEERRIVPLHDQEESTAQATTDTKVIPDCHEERMTKDNDVPDDIAILTEKFGKLYPGKAIELELSYACELLGRTRHRVDAFSRLQKKLANEYGVELIIKSRKSK